VARSAARPIRHRTTSRYSAAWAPDVADEADDGLDGEDDQRDGRRAQVDEPRRVVNRPAPLDPNPRGGHDGGDGQRKWHKHRPDDIRRRECVDGRRVPPAGAGLAGGVAQ
jgi:hypothetical protein